jgi:hypothetical protein
MIHAVFLTEQPCNKSSLMVAGSVRRSHAHQLANDNVERRFKGRDSGVMAPSPGIMMHVR